MNFSSKRIWIKVRLEKWYDDIDLVNNFCRYIGSVSKDIDTSKKNYIK